MVLTAVLRARPQNLPVPVPVPLPAISSLAGYPTPIPTLPRSHAPTLSHSPAMFMGKAK